MNKAPRFTNLALAAFAVIIGSTSFAENTVPAPTSETTLGSTRVFLRAPSEERVFPPTPSEATVITPVPMIIPVADPALNPISASVPDCTTQKEAIVFRVYELINDCGERLPDSGAKGRFNRRFACATEHKVAEVVAEPCTCNDCASEQRVAKIRCEKGECACLNNDYVAALVGDLQSYSRKVRKTAKRVLEKTCKFRVTEDVECVTFVTPSITPKL